MNNKIQQRNGEINNIGGISLIGDLFNSLKILKNVDLMFSVEDYVQLYRTLFI